MLKVYVYVVYEVKLICLQVPFYLYKMLRECLCT